MLVSEFPQDVMKKALSIVKRIESEGEINPFRLAEKNNIDIVTTQIVYVPAFYNRSLIDDSVTIFISDNTNSYAKKMLCWHELGHIFCENHDTDLFDHRINPVSEFTANFFMIHFMPELFSRQPITKDTKIENINKCIALKVATNNKNTIPGLIPIWGEIDLKDKFWDTIK